MLAVITLIITLIIVVEVLSKIMTQNHQTAVTAMQTAMETIKIIPCQCQGQVYLGIIQVLIPPCILIRGLLQHRLPLLPLFILPNSLPKLLSPCLLLHPQLLTTLMLT